MFPANATIFWPAEDPAVPDHAFDRLLPKLVECFGVMFAGFVAGRLGLLSKTESGGLNYFAANFALPAMIFLNLAQLDLTDVQWPFVTGIFLGKVFIFLIVVIITLISSKTPDLAQAAVYAIFATHVNDFGLAYPILLSVYGETHPAYPNYIYLIGLISLALLNPVGFLMIEIQRARNETKLVVQSLDQTVPPGIPVPLQQPPAKGRRAYRMVWSIFKRIATNPNVFMTVLGAVANFIFHGQLPIIMTGVLKDFGDTFQGTVLFLLGLQVASTSVTKDADYLVPGLLLTVKMLISPLVTRGTVKLLCSQSEDPAGLADYGFLYGTVPTAPVVLVYAAQFGMPTETLAMALVLCTLLSGPVMYVSARMLVVQAYDILSYMKQLRETILCLSALGLFSCLGKYDLSSWFTWVTVFFSVAKLVLIWVTLLFILGRKWRKPPHLIFILLLVAQAIMSIGLVIWSSAPKSTWTTYLDISAVTGGQLACRFCTVILAIVLFLTPRYPSHGMQRLLPFFVVFGFGLPGVAVLCLLITTQPMQALVSDSDIVPSFLFGDTEACMAVVVLSFCLVATSGCLLLFHRQRVREPKTPSPFSEAPSDISPVLSDSSDLSTIHEESPKQIEESETEQSPPLPSDTEDPWNQSKATTDECTSNRRAKKARRKKSLNVVSPRLPVLPGKQFVAWGTTMPELESQKNQQDIDDQEIQANRHFTLLLFLCVSMIVGLTTSIWKLLAERRTGIFVALEFLDIILNFGQPVLSVFIFGHDFEPITDPIRKCWRRWRKCVRTKRPSPPPPAVNIQEPQPVAAEMLRRRPLGLITGGLPP